MSLANPYPTVQSTLALARYHQFQESPVQCADYSIAMAYNIWMDRSGMRAAGGASYKRGPDISRLLDIAPLGRFADGTTTPFGINYALEQLGVPARWSPLGSLALLRRELVHGNLAIVSVGKLKLLGADQNWGHVKLAVWHDPHQNRFAFLDPGYREAEIQWLTEAELSAQWWYRPFRLMWPIALTPRAT